MKTLPVGTISHGTLRSQDLARAFCDALRQVRGHLPRQYLYLTGRKDDDPLWDSDNVQEAVVDLMEALDFYCPPYCRFGAHDGDGSDFGCWPDLERVQEAIADGDVATIDDPVWLDKLDCTATSCPGFALFVNDHGNRTLYQRVGRSKRWKALWEVV